MWHRRPLGRDDGPLLITQEHPEKRLNVPLSWSLPLALTLYIPQIVWSFVLRLASKTCLLAGRTS